MLLSCGCYNFTDETISGTHPVKEIRITRLDGHPYELVVSVQRGVRLDSLVDISYFDGLDHRMSLETAKRKLGEPQREFTQTEMKLPVSVYPVEKGEIGFMAVPSSGGTQHQVWAFPTNQSPDSIILDASLRKQILSCLSKDQLVRVYVLRDVGFGGITLRMTSNRVDCQILGLRDGE